MPNGAIDLGVPKQKLNGSKIAGFVVNLRHFRSAQRMGAVPAGLKSNCGHPVAHQPSVLARRDVRAVMETTGKHEHGAHQFRCVRPCCHRFPCVLRQFELNGLTGFALHDCYPFANTFAADQVPHLEANQIAPTQLAVDGDVEQRQIA